MKRIFSKTEDKKINSYLVYTLLFLICTVGVFWQFWIHGKTMIIKPDGYLQHYTALVKLRHIWRDFFATGSFPFWSWDTGMGADTIASYAGVMLDPFAYVAAAFGEKYIDIGYTVSFILRLYVSGIAFGMFASYMKFENWKVILGALSYAFSGWALGCMMQSFFVYTMILFPLLILGIEKAFRREAPALLIGSTAAMAVFTVYMLYMSGIMAAIYCIVRYFYFTSEETSDVLEYSPKFQIKKFFGEMLRLLAFVAIAMLISLPVFIPRFYALMNASRDSANNAALFYTLKRHLLMIPSFFTDSDVFANYSYPGAGVLFTLMIPIFLRKEHRRKTPVIMWSISFVILAVPVLGKVMNGFSYPTGRWMYAMVFFFLWSGLEALKLEMPKCRKMIKFWVGFLVLIWLIFDVGLDLFDTYRRWTLLVNVILGAVVLLLLSFTGNRKSVFDLKKQQKDGKVQWLFVKQYLLMGIVVINLMAINNIRYAPSVTGYLEDAYDVGQFYSKIKKSVQRVGQQIEDNDFYRIYQLTGISNNHLMHVPVNENIYWGNRSTYCYLSTIDQKWHDFNKALTNSAGYSQRVSVWGNDLRTRMDFLFGVKYFLGDKKLKEDTLYDHQEKNCLAVGYGYDSKKLIKDVEVLENKYSIGLGTVYEYVIPRSEFDLMTAPEKEEALMQAAVLEEEALDTLHQVKHRTAEEIEKNSFDKEYTLTEAKGGILTENGFKVSSEDTSTFTISLDSVEDCEIYVYFKGLERVVPSYEEQRVKALGENSGFLKQLRYDAKNMGGLRLGDFSANLSTDTITKRIVNYSGTNQAFTNVTDYCINMGYYEKFEGDIEVYFQKKGSYTYEDLQILILPRGNYDAQAQKLQENKLNVEILKDNYVKGNVDTKNGGLLYLSIIQSPGWKVFVDGKEAEQVYLTNIAFTGVEVAPGKHQIELKYCPVGFRISCVMAVIGILLFAVCQVWYVGRKQELTKG